MTKVELIVFISGILPALCDTISAKVFERSFTHDAKVVNYNVNDKLYYNDNIDNLYSNLLRIKQGFFEKYKLMELKT